ncbi:guanine nucleotide exchange factor DBS-like [Drosophila eugracilis]|uniref:guanine nucleotide exchange factor DBS-like n=1 Tax=Drosophila eugracilis TaxID=29029 RepID=UPI001BDAD817|nr:guanine nucleotide exchange factor DBS-like [Drosophila eugracilis]
MLIVLKCVNDSMHQVSITGFPSDIAQQGRLLMEDSFKVWSVSKGDIRLRTKPHQRHIFLYKKSMLFCKKSTKPCHNKSLYQFKYDLMISKIGLTESLRGDASRFEIWLKGRQEVYTLKGETIGIGVYIRAQGNGDRGWLIEPLIRQYPGPGVNAHKRGRRTLTLYRCSSDDRVGAAAASCGVPCREAENCLGADDAGGRALRKSLRTLSLAVRAPIHADISE